jgi:hypothetical protein
VVIAVVVMTRASAIMPFPACIQSWNCDVLDIAYLPQLRVPIATGRRATNLDRQDDGPVTIRQLD